MSEPINLNKARKARARTEAETLAAQNRVRFGQTKAVKDLAKARAAKAARDLDAKKLDR